MPPHPDRDTQFRHIIAQVRYFQAAGQPVISVDTKKGAQARWRRPDGADLITLVRAGVWFVSGTHPARRAAQGAEERRRLISLNSQLLTIAPGDPRGLAFVPMSSEAETETLWQS